MTKVRYYFLPTPINIKPYLSLAGGFLNVFANGEDETTFAAKHSVGLKVYKFLFDVSYFKTETLDIAGRAL